MTLLQAFQTAYQHHLAGRLAEAETLYRQILAVQPNNPDALQLLGLVAHQVGRHDLAVEWIQRAIVLNPNFPGAYTNLAEAYRSMGKFEEAIAACRRALALNADFPNPWVCLGSAFRQRGQLDEAVSAYRRALELKPDFTEARNNLGITLADQGKFEEAAAAYRRALEFKPDYAEAHNNLGIALRELGQSENALASYHRALELKPNYADAGNNLGIMLRERGQLDRAAAAYRRALELKPAFPEAWNNLGAALTDARQLDEAMAAYRRAIELRPAYPEAYNNLGSALKDRGDLDEAITAFRSAIKLRPEFAAAHSNLAFILNFHPGYDSHAIAAECARWERQHATPLRASIRAHGNNRDAARRLRIGYVSSNFFTQAECYFVVPLLEAHDHTRFEIHAYSDVIQPDAVTDRLRKAVDVWHDVRALSDDRLAEQIRADSIDVLIDLSMHMSRSWLPMFARQPAPVQVTWLAYPGTTGLHTIGYRLTDAHMEPTDADSTWSTEEPVRLPDCWCCYNPVSDSPEVNKLPALSADSVTFGSLNNFMKVNDLVLARWARVLGAVKGSRLVMLCPEGLARERIRAFFASQGIPPERLELIGFLPRSEYLNLYHRIDIGLDPFPYNGITTTCDSLWMGVPVLTLRGVMPASRAGLSLLSTVGLEALAASSEDDYVRLAVELANDLPRLAELRSSLRPRMLASPLMDAPRFARNVEAAYQSMWERWLRKG